MKPRLMLGLALALAALTLLAAACGGNGADEPAIRTQKGLSVAALASGAEQTVSLGGDAAVQMEAPVPAPAFGFGRAVIPARGIAPFPLPAQQQSLSGITVQGFGSATADADSAVLELYFGTAFVEPPIPLPEPMPGQTEPGFQGEGVFPRTPPKPFPDEVQPITEADLQPIVDAIAAQGVSPDDIEVIIDPYYDPYFSSANVRVTVRNIDALDAIVNAAQDAAAELGEIDLQGNSVSYTVDDCATLELAAMDAAVKDASERAAAFAQALGVGLGSIAGASHYSYSPFGGTPCDSGFGGPYPLGGVPFAEGQSPEVQLVANVSITYSIQ